MRFRKKPVIIEAIQWDGESETLAELSEFTGQRRLRFDPERETLIIETLEGNHIATKGDWIIKGVKGECYPCKPDIFELTYELVSDVAAHVDYMAGAGRKRR